MMLSEENIVDSSSALCCGKSGSGDPSSPLFPPGGYIPHAAGARPLQDREVETAGAVHGMHDCELQHAEGTEEADFAPWLLGGLEDVCGDSVSDVDGEEFESGGSDGGG